jgi:hypothetical protein
VYVTQSEHILTEDYGKYSQTNKIIINDYSLEHVNHNNYQGYDITYNNVNKVHKITKYKWYYSGGFRLSEAPGAKIILRPLK